MRSCRTDGVMLRPLYPLSSIDAAFTRFDGALVWQAYDQPASTTKYRWSMVVAVNLATNVTIFPGDLQPENESSMVCWQVRADSDQISGFQTFDQLNPLLLHTSSLPKDPLLAPDPGSVHWVVAPVLPGGLVIMGEVKKWAPMSRRRVSGACQCAHNHQ